MLDTDVPCDLATTKVSIFYYRDIFSPLFIVQFRIVRK